MDAYKKSVQDVDVALKRLNATLESYRLSTLNKPADSPQQAPVRDRAQRSAAARPADRLPEPKKAVTPGDISTLRERTPSIEGQDPIWREVAALRGSDKSIPEIKKRELQATCDSVRRINHILPDHGHCVPLHLILARKYLQLGYPDLAVGSAYRALLLCDAVQDPADEYHTSAASEMRTVIQQVPIVERIRLLKSELHGHKPAPLRDGNEDMDVEVDLWVREHYLLWSYRLLSFGLTLCDCSKSAQKFVVHGLKLYPKDEFMASVQQSNQKHVRLLHTTGHVKSCNMDDVNTWPEQGHVRREVYPWNEWEPNRLEELPELNALMAEVAPKLEVRAVELPDLTGTGEEEVVTQLGVFAKEDVSPGEIVLGETSMLTANNKLQDALCDACSADLPGLNDDGAGNVHQCPHCEVVFCSATCLERAEESYHQAICDADLDSILRDVPPAEAADSLYSLLLLRALAMAETQDCHPLELKEVKYIWGDFHNLPLDKNWKSVPMNTRFDFVTAAHHGDLPRSLPFTFDHNVRLPLQMLEKMDIDIFCSPQYETWVLNTLYAKFRGTASARLSGQGGRKIRGPEVSAVHPMWCLANHSCDPNVSWEWGGSIQFKVREERAVWDGGDSGKVIKSHAGIRRGEEVLNHYCDITLPVKERRAWARGALGGDCMCARCVFEAEEAA